MINKNFQIGQEVVRSKGDYVVGRVGNIIAINTEKNRAQVQWSTVITWVSQDAIEPTLIPYKILDGSYDVKKGRHIWPKYINI
jgi:hypothetical protein